MQYVIVALFCLFAASQANVAIRSSQKHLRLKPSKLTLLHFVEICDLPLNPFLIDSVKGLNASFSKTLLAQQRTLFQCKHETYCMYV